MKTIRHINIRHTAVAIVALAGLAVAIIAYSSNSSTNSATKDLDATIETVADRPESVAKVTSPAAVSSVGAKVESPTASSSVLATAAPSTATPSTGAPSTATPSTGASASPEADPAIESAVTEADSSIETGETAADPSTEAPATTTPATATPDTATPETATPDTTTPDTTTPATASPSIPALALSPTIRFVTFALDGTNIDTSILVEEGGLGRNDIVSVEFTYTKFGIERTVAATNASSTTTSSIWLIDGLMLRVGDTVTIHAVNSRGNTDDTTVTVELSTSMG